MIRQLIKIRRQQVLIDINTQNDFFLDQGKARVGNRRRVLIHIRRMMALARAKKIPVISICEVYSNGNGANALGYCVDGTEGQKKISYTLLSNRASFAADNNTDLPIDILRRYRQIILHKRCIDPFDEPRIDRLLSEIRANEFILIGAIAEGAVEATALGLLQRGKRVSVVVDAVGAQDKQKARHALRKIGAKGAKLVETRRLAGTSHLKSVGVLKNADDSAEEQSDALDEIQLETN
jgi:nicotinamidase-related amidase